MTVPSQMPLRRRDMAGVPAGSPGTGLREPESDHDREQREAGDRETSEREIDEHESDWAGQGFNGPPARDDPDPAAARDDAEPDPGPGPGTEADDEADMEAGA